MRWLFGALLQLSSRFGNLVSIYARGIGTVPVLSKKAVRALGIAPVDSEASRWRASVFPLPEFSGQTGTKASCPCYLSAA